MKHNVLTAFGLLACLVTFSQSFHSLAEKELRSFSNKMQYDAKSVASNNYDVNFYRCSWNIDPAVRFISGSVANYFTMVSASNNIVMDLHAGLTVDSIYFRGAKTNFTHAANHALQINFGATLNAGQKDSVKIFYKGIPPSTGFGSFNLSTHVGVPIMWTLSEPYGAPTWWPCKDSNTDKPDSIDITLTYPSQYTSSSNGLPVSETSSVLSKTTYWKHRYPIAPYLVAVAITNYNIDTDAVQLPSRSMPLVMYAYPESVNNFKAATQVAKIALQGFSPLITEYPFSKERYAQTQFGWGGGMEHQTNSFIVSAGSGLVAHELAHQWFGDKVTCGSWHDLWLNEGFATYMEYVYLEIANPSLRQQQLQSWRLNITSLPGGSVYIPDTTDLNRLFNGRLTYLKGGYLLHMLRWKLGDSTFFKGVRRYVTDPALAYRTARTADLQRNLEAESGQELAEFFKDWYLGEGYPNYKALWFQQSTNQLRLQLNQTTSHNSVSFFEMPVPVLLRGATRDTIVRLNHKKDGEIFSLNPGFLVDTVLIDPQQWLLTRENLARKSATPIGFDELTIYPNPVSQRLTMVFPSSLNQFVKVEIFNAIGERVHYQTVSTVTPVYINMHRFAAGIYWIRTTGNGINETRKVLVTRK